MSDDRPFRQLCVTLEEQIHSENGSIKTFRAVKRGEYDDVTQFIGVNIEGVSAIETARDNIRSVVYQNRPDND